ncbi:MAG: flagellar basal body P-ring formation protein FlgA [Geminicoccaceae bacterium]|nr:flagellar basal body P-ring formation protein FlgA [Geminicoccaceae bacterium]
MIRTFVIVLALLLSNLTVSAPSAGENRHEIAEAAWLQPAAAAVDSASSPDWLAPGQPLTAEMLEALVREQLDEPAQDRHMEIALHAPLLPMPNKAAQAMRLQIEGMEIDGRTGRFRAQLIATLTGGDRGRLEVAGRVIEQIPMVVPSRAVRRGERLAPEDLEIVWRSPGRVAGEPLSRIDLAVGMEAARSLARGRPVTTADLRRPRLIERGDVVEVVYRARGLELTIVAEAETDAGLGEMVELVNIASGKRLRARTSNIRQAMIVDTQRAGARP